MSKLASARTSYGSRSVRFAAACLLLCASVLSSQGQENESSVQPSLFLTSPEISGPFDVGLRFEIEPEWYLYWINPGDAGLPVDVRWTLPEGWAAGPLRFPTPEKIVKGGIKAFGYHNELVLLCRITPRQKPDGSAPDSIRADLDWLVCRESCLPGRAWLALDLSPARLKGALIDQARLDEYAGRFPRAISSRVLKVGALEVERTGSTRLVTVRISGSGAPKVTDFYPEVIDGFAVDLSDIRILSDRICLRLTPEADASVLHTLRGLVIIQDRGYQLEASAPSE